MASLAVATSAHAQSEVPAPEPSPVPDILSCSTELKGLPDFADLQSILRGILTRPALHCTYATVDSCTGPAIDSHWHFEAVDADLMREEMDRWRKEGHSRGREPIAIVDGRFGPNLNEVLQKEPASREERNGAVDKNVHGSLVAQFYGGEEGLGLVPENPLHLYDVGVDESEIDSELGFRAAKDACKNGQRIINASFNTTKGKVPADELNSVVEELAAKGCVLVKAAGNDGIRDEAHLRGFEKDFSLYLSAGETRHSGGIAKNSDRGNAYAPGEGIAVKLPSTQGGVCHDGVKKPEAILSGTSFAAPILGSIGSQVLEVLNSSDKFRDLAPLEQAKTIVQVTRSGAITPTSDVSGFRAVKNAMGWVDRAAGKEPAAPSCTPLPANCFQPKDPPDCAQDNACSVAIRRMITDCPAKLAENPVGIFLAARAVHPWMALRVVDALAQGPRPEAGAIVSALYPDEYWLSELATQKAPFASLPAYADLYARARLPFVKKPGDVEKKLVKFAVRAQGESPTSQDILEGFLRNDVTRTMALDEIASAITARGKNVTVSGIQSLDLLGLTLRAIPKGPEGDAFRLRIAKNLPADQQLFVIKFALSLLVENPPESGSKEVLTALKPMFKQAPMTDKILLRRSLDLLKDRGQITADDVAEFNQAL